jgi:hypothetical protein
MPIAGARRALGRDCDHGFGAADDVHIPATVAQAISQPTLRNSGGTGSRDVALRERHRETT